MAFHAISAPCGQGDGEATISSNGFNAEGRIFESRVDALKALKTNKLSRLKTFNSYTDALTFASAPFNASNEYGDGTRFEQNNTTDSTTPVVSEGCPFKSLTAQELKKLKQAIIAEDELIFDELVADNARYLTTPCDTPSILHSGTRANALHIAASANQKGSPKMTEKILDNILNTNLMERMYPGESAEARTRSQE